MDAGPDQTVNEGDLVAFSGSASDPGAETLSYGWQFGDGSTTSGSLIPSHTYTNDGSYLVTLTVDDGDGGSVADTLTVIVNPLLTISGQVTGIPSGFVATVDLSGEAFFTTTTVGGSYSFPDLLPGTYTVTPALGGQTFSPADSTFAMSSNVSNVDFDIPSVIWFVDKDSPTSTPDGMSWATAYLHPQNGSDFANSGEQVWVAEGSYFPMDTSVTTVPVLIMGNGVEYYGGFAATETLLSERDLSAHTTTLDGLGVTERIVTGANNSLLSGFVVTGANVPLSANNAAIVAGTPVVNFLLYDSVITGNATTTGSAGSSGLTISSGEVKNCVFSYNVGENGPIYVIRGTTRDVTINNSLFYRNTAIQGGGIVVAGNGNTFTINNSTFAYNEAGSGRTIFIDQGGTLPISTNIINNTIIWGAVGADQIAYFDNPAVSPAMVPVINYSNIQGIAASPLLGSTMVDPAYGNTTTDDYRLSSTSPLIDAGSNTLVPGNITTDLDGNNRFLDDPGTTDTGAGTAPIVDMGAYEYVAP